MMTANTILKKAYKKRKREMMKDHIPIVFKEPKWLATAAGFYHRLPKRIKRLLLEGIIKDVPANSPTPGFKNLSWQHFKELDKSENWWKDLWFLHFNCIHILNVDEIGRQEGFLKALAYYLETYTEVTKEKGKEIILYYD